MNEYHKGNEKKAKEDMCQLLHRYIYSLMKEMYIPGDLFEDAYQEGIIAILENIKNYDPEYTKPTVYFKPFIKYGIMDFVKRNVYKSSKHYYRKLEKVETSIEEIITEQNPVTINTIAAKSGMKEKDVKATLNHLSRIKHTVSAEETIDFSINSEKSTEEIAISRLETKQLYHAINKVDKKSKNNIVRYFGLNGCVPESIVGIAAKEGRTAYEVKKDINDTLFLLKMKMEHQSSTVLLLKS